MHIIDKRRTHVYPKEIIVVTEFFVDVRGPALVLVADDTVYLVCLGYMIPVYRCKRLTSEHHAGAIRKTIPVKCSWVHLSSLYCSKSVKR